MWTVFAPGNSRALMPAAQAFSHDLLRRACTCLPLKERARTCQAHKPWAWADALSTLGMGLSHDHGREGWKDLIGARDTHGKKLMERFRGCREGA